MVTDKRLKDNQRSSHFMDVVLNVLFMVSERSFKFYIFTRNITRNGWYTGLKPLVVKRESDSAFFFRECKQEEELIEVYFCYGFEDGNLDNLCLQFYKFSVIENQLGPVFFLVILILSSFIFTKYLWQMKRHYIFCCIYFVIFKKKTKVIYTFSSVFPLL